MIRRAVIVVLTLAAVVTAWLWLRSSVFADVAHVPISRKYYLIGYSRSGGVSVALVSNRTGAVRSGLRSWEFADEGIPILHPDLMDPVFSDDWIWRGINPEARPAFSYRSKSLAVMRRTVRSTSVTFPHWLPLVVFTTYPIIAFIRGPVRRYRRRKRGLCLRCGYDLTGNVTGVCSECGTEIGPA